jgi:hypothetical protein
MNLEDCSPKEYKMLKDYEWEKCVSLVVVCRCVNGLKKYNNAFSLFIVP